MFLFVLLFAFAMLAVCFPALWIRRKDFGLSSSFLRTGREKEGGKRITSETITNLCCL